MPSFFKGKIDAAPLGDKISFRAKAAEPTTELFLIGSQLQLMARGIGELVTEQPPGLYKLKAQAGRSIREQGVILLNKPVELDPLPPLEVASAVPLNETKISHEYHQAAATKLSREIHRTIGKGSTLFVFARDWTPEGEPPASGHHPAEQLWLCSAEGERRVDFEKDSVADLKLDPCAGCRVALDPGSYRLSVGTSAEERFEMPVHAPRGWHQQIFLLQRRDPLRGRRPDLGTASVLLSQRPEFDTSDGHDRLAEMAKVALTERRPVGSGLRDQFLHGKYINPMLGIIGGHLLLLENQPDKDLLRIVVNNLRGLLQDPHPDVEALALAAGLHTDFVFATPPMLRASWNIVVERAAQHPALVPRDSVSAKIAARVTLQDPWLIWLRPAAEEWSPSELTKYGSYLAPLLKTGTRKTSVAGVASDLKLPPATISSLVAAAKPLFRKTRSAAKAKKKAPARKRG